MKHYVIEANNLQISNTEIITLEHSNTETNKMEHSDTETNKLECVHRNDDLEFSNTETTKGNLLTQTQINWSIYTQKWQIGK